MTLGLPGHLVQSALSRALARATHWFGLICLFGALAAVGLLSMTRAGSELTVTVAVILGMAGLLVVLARRRTVLVSLAYLLTGTACVYLYTDTVLSAPAVLPASIIFLVALPKMALVMVGGAGSGLFLGALWSTAGFLLAEGAALLAMAHAGVIGGRDFFTVSAYVFLTTVLLLAGLGRRRGRLAQPALLRAAEDDAASTLRDALDNRSIALINDTTVTQLVALANAVPGAVSPHLHMGLTGALHVLRDTDWLTDADPHEPGDLAASALFRAIDRCRSGGLIVEITGDSNALDRLTAAVDRELALAAEHCLGNVLLHAGVTAAEVSVESDDDTVSVMIADAGSGFTLTGSSRGRLGLRQSVRRRVDRVGGSVEIWTRPGAGTTVRLTVPVAVPDAVPTLALAARPSR
ncbi:hypothetical protein GY21_04355 [Cryobacterium roopkundense]|uniref:Signal transduction histidine kinase n=1 Tax=Cryobacterium roopkundense TaxID=1001240 RepID=A0A099JMS5_9MICO|nr:ATP-binding protein [Cryobacterium roopkundense]KGJ79664.1 hypothetical protein GY21_04355 [Cryobacterium roopkundense]MBB5642506.1 signal transduction histidine kinase [Cryobacterium roopkundense]